ncbi:MAG: FkbM family methyltransferase [Betaproteobacteria bacterium]|nr:FkbM family methyltransferase [Betaproteobacteria bacterium]
MSFVSYAQNFEDVMLWRALREVGQGFYIDVGANDPCIDSVSKAFYERGWHGINIEPLPLLWADLERERPRDINLQCAVGEFCGEMDLWEPEVRGWASVAPDVIAMHQKEGVDGVMQKVPVRTLAEICRAHVQGEAHFLKIDVEGHERSVIAGMDFTAIRPWIVVVEATLPNSTIENHQEWEPLLLANGYLHVYADGLNRFYLAQEKEDLREHFRYPPNVLDDFILSRQVTAEGNLRGLEQRLTQAEDRLWQAEDQARQVEALARELAQALEAAEAQIRRREEALRTARTEIKAIHASTSWRVTRPLRGLMRLLRGDFSPLTVVGCALRRRLLNPPRIVPGGRAAEPDLSPWAGRIYRALEIAAEQKEEQR